jgi:hypothetical protein
LNTRGLPIDTDSAKKRAIQFSDHYTQLNTWRFNEITGVNPTQRDKILEYIAQREEIADLGDLRSKTLKRIVQDDLPQDLQDVINIRLETSKASIKKLETMMRCTDSDGRARGLFLYGGAHTMRWSAKRIQPQNFTRPDMKLLESHVSSTLKGTWWSNPGMVGHNGGPPLDDMPGQPAWVFEAGMRFPRPLGALAKAMRGFIAAPNGKRSCRATTRRLKPAYLYGLPGAYGYLRRSATGMMCTHVCRAVHVPAAYGVVRGLHLYQERQA